MKALLSILSLVLSLSQLAEAAGPRANCWSRRDQGSTLQVFHVYSTCSPFRPAKATSWDESVLEMQAKDQARLLYLWSLVAKKSVVPIAAGRQIVQSPTYIVRASIGTPPQTFLLAMDTSNDAAWLPCSGCIGCSSITTFTPLKSTSYNPLPCSAAQCKQVIKQPLCSTCNALIVYYYVIFFSVFSSHALTRLLLRCRQ